jgi:hypothetical protein
MGKNQSKTQNLKKFSQTQFHFHKTITKAKPFTHSCFLSNAFEALA